MDARWHVEQLQGAALARGTRVRSDDFAHHGAVDVGDLLEIQGFLTLTEGQLCAPAR